MTEVIRQFTFNDEPEKSFTQKYVVDENGEYENEDVQQEEDTQQFDYSSVDADSLVATLRELEKKHNELSEENQKLSNTHVVSDDTNLGVAELIKTMNALELEYNRLYAENEQLTKMLNGGVGKSTSSDATKTKQKREQKRVPTEYNIYVKANMSEVREANPGIKPKVALSIIADKWRQYKGKPEPSNDKPKTPRKSSPKKKTTKKTDTDSGEKKKKQPSAYNTFIAEELKKMKDDPQYADMKSKDRFKRAVEIYKEKTAVEKTSA